MSKLGDDLKSNVAKIFQEEWETREGSKVPDPSDLGLGNDAVTLKATVLYADLNGSTSLVNGHKNWFAAEIFKTYLMCAAKIIRDEGGDITSYDGDRIMAVYIGDTKNTDAARTALKISGAVKDIINPALKKKYPDSKYVVKQTVGIDTSELFATRTGVRGDNDIVWVGRAANYAAKLSSRSGSVTQITDDVYSCLLKGSKIGTNGNNMWTKGYSSEIGKTIYTSNWTWSV